MDSCIYNRNDVCQMLGVSQFTIKNWYMWQRKQLDEGNIDAEYLPHPERKTNVKGQPLYWSLEMISDLKSYQSSIIKGRNGVFGKYTNPKKH